METSLARQLQQLRTTSTTGDKAGKNASVASSGPSIVDLRNNQELTHEQLDILANECFNQLSGNSGLTQQSISVLEKFRHLVFKEIKPDTDVDVDEEKGINIENLLIILAPHLRTPSVQFLLQYLINNHKIHDVCTEWLLFISLQHYEYKLFNRIVESLPLKRSPEESRPRWVEHFRSACHPATTIGLHRHLACDRGFFSLLCEHFISVIRDHVPIFGKEDNVSYNGLVACVVKSLLGALNLVGSISEPQTHLLMQVIVAALKCNHKEFKAAGSILFSALVPRVKLNQKATGKLLRVLDRSTDQSKVDSKCSVESLGMVAILYRSQSSTETANVDKYKILELILRHDSVIRDSTAQINQMENEDKVFARRLFKILAIIASDLTFDETPTENVALLLEMIVQILNSSTMWSNELLPTSEVAEILIETASKSLIHYKSLKKKLKKKDDIGNDQIIGDKVRKRSVIAYKTILDYLRNTFKDEYCAKFNVDMKDSSDILFMDHSEFEIQNSNEIDVDGNNLKKSPTVDEIAVKKLLLDNTLIKEMSKSYATFNKKYRFREAKDQLKENGAAIKMLFEKATPSFLLRQISASSLVKILVNCVKAYERKPKTLSKVLSFALNEGIIQNPAVQKELRDTQTNLDLLFLQQLYIVNFDCKEEIAEAIRKHSKYSNLEIFSQMLVTIDVAKDQASKPKDFIEIVTRKLIALVNPSMVMKFLDDLIDGNKGLREPDVVAIALLLSSVCVGRIEANVASNENSRVQFEIIMKMSKLAMVAIQEFEVFKFESWTETEHGSEEIKSLSKLVECARDKKMFPLETLRCMFCDISRWAKSNAIVELKAEQKTQLRIRIAALIITYENFLGEKDTGMIFVRLIQQQLCENQREQFQSFTAEILFLQSENIDLSIWDKLLESEKAPNATTQKISNELKQRCADLLSKSLSTHPGEISSDAEQIKLFLSIKSPTMPLILASLNSNSNKKKIVKAIFNCFETTIGNPAAITSDAISYLPLLKYLCANKSTIISGCGPENRVKLEGNIRTVMQSFFQSVENANGIIGGLLDFIVNFPVTGIFEPLLPFISEINGINELKEISQYGSSLLLNYKKDPISISKALELLLLTFLPNILHVSIVQGEEMLWEFLCKIIQEHRIQVIPNGELKSLSQFSIEIIQIIISKLNQKSNEADKHNLFKKIFDLFVDLGKDKRIESPTLMAARYTIDTIIKEILKDNPQSRIAPSKMFAEKLLTIWGDSFQESGASSGRLSRGGRSSKFTALYGKTYIRSLSNLTEEEHKWKQTLFLLENFLNYTKILDITSVNAADCEGFDSILKPLNLLLKVSLNMDELYDNSYTLDILLSAIHEVVDINSKIAKNNTDATSPELIVQCIRTCKTPDTKATALLILAKQASCASSAEYVMHNSIPIFTFMGSHFLKIEAKSSFDVACQAIDIIIPHIQRACIEKEKENKGKRNLLKDTSLSIINTFVDASSDMPPHRFRSFMSRLVKNLSSFVFQSPLNANAEINAKSKKPENYLWIVTLLLLKADSKKRVYTGKGNETESVKMTAEEKHHQLGELYSAFNDDITFQMGAVLRMLSEMKTDMPEIRALLGIKCEDEVMDTGMAETKISESTKQFEMVRIKMMFFISSGLLQSTHFVANLIETLEVDINSSDESKLNADILQQQLKSLIELSIINMEHYEQNIARKKRGTRGSKIQQQLAVCCEKVLEAALSILPSYTFVLLLGSLLCNSYSVVRKKSLEVFNIKLQQISSMKSKEKHTILHENSAGEVLKVLAIIAKGRIPVNEDMQDAAITENETSINQQMALMCLRTFARATQNLQNSNHIMGLIEVSKMLSKKTFLKSILEAEGDGSVVASILLCLTETLSCIGPHAVVMLPSFIDWILEIMLCIGKSSVSSNKESKVQPMKLDSSVVLSSIILAIQKCMENFGGFLNPYYGRFVNATCQLTWIHQKEGSLAIENEARKSKARNIDRIGHLQAAMSKGIPTHSLIDIVSRCHQDLANESPHCIIALSNILKDNVSHLDKNEALAVSGQFLEYFLRAFKYRQSTRCEEEERNATHPTKNDINLVENRLIDAFLSLALKLPLDEFKPMFYRLANMAMVSFCYYVIIGRARQRQNISYIIYQNIIQCAIVNYFCRKTTH